MLISCDRVVDSATIITFDKRLSPKMHLVNEIQF